MTPQEIRDAVAANPAWSALGTTYAAAGQIASEMNAAGTFTRTAAGTLIGIDTVLEVLGTVDGKAFLDALNTLAGSNTLVKYQLQVLSANRIDVGKQAIRTQLGNLVGVGGITAGQVNALLALGVVADPVPVDAVYQALQGAA